MLRNFNQVYPSNYALNVIKELDKDGDGAIDFDEFYDVFGKLEKQTEDDLQQLIKSFKFLANGSTKISKEKLVEILEEVLVDESPDEILSKIEFDDNNQIDYEEVV